MNCPQCRIPLFEVRYPSGSMLNREQFDASKAGDYYCTNCKGTEARTGYKYFWEKDLTPEPQPEAPGVPQCSCNNEPVAWGAAVGAALEFGDCPRCLHPEHSGVCGASISRVPRPDALMERAMEVSHFEGRSLAAGSESEKILWEQIAAEFRSIAEECAKIAEVQVTQARFEAYAHHSVDAAFRAGCDCVASAIRAKFTATEGRKAQ